MQDPHGYEANKSVATDIVDFFLPKLMNGMEWKTEEIVLDYGCGAGSPGYKVILPKVEKFNSTMFSVDVSAKMLAFAKEHYPHERITYGCGDILDKFPFEDVAFDKIFAVNVFHFIDDIKKALAGLLKLLKSGGTLGFCMAVADSVGLQVYKELALSETWKPYMKDYWHFYPKWAEFPEGKKYSGVHELLESSGFHVIELEIVDRNYHFDNIETLLDVSVSAHPCRDNIPEHLHGALKEDIRKHYTRLLGIPLNSKTIDYPHQIVWGVVKKP